jgi:diguanylate cyclase (GGDEF)-like protein
MASWLLFSLIHNSSINTHHNGYHDGLIPNDEVQNGDLIYLTSGGNLFGWGHVANIELYKEPQSQRQYMRLLIPGQIMQPELLRYNELLQIAELRDLLSQVDENLVEMTVREANVFNGLIRNAGARPPADLTERLDRFGLPDTSKVQKRLSLAVKKFNVVSALYLDLDNFKKANDDYGHAAGDNVISEGFNLIRERIGARGEVFHPSNNSDELIVLLPNVAEAEARALAEEVRKAIEENEFQAVGRGLITTTIGHASYPEDCEAPDQLVNAADEALRRQKQIRKNSVASVREFAKNESE